MERRDDKESVDVEVLMGKSVFDLEGLYEETDETSSFELSYPSSRSVLSFALICNKNIICQHGLKQQSWKYTDITDQHD